MPPKLALSAYLTSLLGALIEKPLQVSTAKGYLLALRHYAKACGEGSGDHIRNLDWATETNAAAFLQALQARPFESQVGTANGVAVAMDVAIKAGLARATLRPVQQIFAAAAKALSVERDKRNRERLAAVVEEASDEEEEPATSNPATEQLSHKEIKAAVTFYVTAALPDVQLMANESILAPGAFERIAAASRISFLVSYPFRSMELTAMRVSAEPATAITPDDPLWGLNVFCVPDNTLRVARSKLKEVSGKHPRIFKDSPATLVQLLAAYFDAAVHVFKLPATTTSVPLFANARTGAPLSENGVLDVCASLWERSIGKRVTNRLLRRSMSRQLVPMLQSATKTAKQTIVHVQALAPKLLHSVGQHLAVYHDIEETEGSQIPSLPLPDAWEGFVSPQRAASVVHLDLVRDSPATAVRKSSKKEEESSGKLVRRASTGVSVPSTVASRIRSSPSSSPPAPAPLHAIAEDEDLDQYAFQPPSPSRHGPLFEPLAFFTQPSPDLGVADDHFERLYGVHDEPTSMVFQRAVAEPAAPLHAPVAIKPSKPARKTALVIPPEALPSASAAAAKLPKYKPRFLVIPPGAAPLQPPKLRAPSAKSEKPARRGTTAAAAPLVHAPVVQRGSAHAADQPRRLMLAKASLATQQSQQQGSGKGKGKPRLQRTRKPRA